MNSAALFILFVGLVAVCIGQIQYTDWGSWENELRPGSLYTENFHGITSGISSYTTSGSGSAGDAFQGVWAGIEVDVVEGNFYVDGSSPDHVSSCPTASSALPYAPGLRAASDTLVEGLRILYSNTAPFGYPTAIAGYFATVDIDCNYLPSSAATPAPKIYVRTNVTDLVYANSTLVAANGYYFFGITSGDQITEVVFETAQPSSTTGYTYSFLWGQAYTNTYIRQDPHFVGLQGEAYHVMGEPKKWFNIISDFDFQFNAYFESPCEGKWGLSYMTKFAFLVKGWQIMIDTTGNPTINNNIIWINRWGSVPLGVNGTYGAFGRPWENNFWLDTPEWGFTIERHIVDFSIQKPGWMFWGTNCVPAYFNLQAVNEKAKHMNVHGLLGQTAHHKHKEANTGAQGEGEIEGTYKDYEVSGPFGTDFKFNRYTGPLTF
jgi:hypothetical protein